MSLPTPYWTSTNVSAFAPSRGSAVLAELLQHFGLGPRKCRDCGEIFAVPPYMECKDWSLCEPCGSKRFLAWAQTDEGKLEIEKARLRLQQPNNAGDN